MANQPFSAKKPRSLPTFTPTQDPATTFANWATQLAPSVKNAAPQPTPQNFSITNARGGLTLNWSPVLQASGADGYEILKSPSGSFTNDLQIIPVKDPNQSTYFDGTGGTAKTAFYRIRTTSGTAANPQSQRGPESGVIKHTSIDAADTATTPVTFFDNYTTDATRATARRGNYGAIKLSSQSQPAKTRIAPGGSGASSGASNVPSAGSSTTSGVSTGQNSSTGSGTGSTAPTGPPGSAPAGASGTPFSQITSGTNKSATMVVQAGSSIAPSASNPGSIQANALWNITDQTANYTANQYDDVWCTGSFTVTLPTTATRVKVTNRGSGSITVTPASGTILGNASMVLGTKYSSVELACDGGTDLTVE